MKRSNSSIKDRLVENILLLASKYQEAAKMFDSVIKYGIYHLILKPLILDGLSSFST